MRFAFLDSLLQFNSGPGLQLPAGLSSFCRSGAPFAGWTAGVWQSKAMTLDPIQLRVLGTLIEKEITTPENYPLSLNALISGCNQKSSRQPVMDLSEDELRGGLRLLEESGFVAVSRDGRVPKYEHRARTVLNLRRDHTAILCLLLLRGPQTPGELRSRADRMYSFDDVEAVESTLRGLMTEMSSEDSQGRGVRPLVDAMPRQPGSREIRYGHLLSGPIAQAGTERLSALPHVMLQDDHDPESRALLAERVKELEGHLEALRAMIGRLEMRLDSQSTAGEIDSGSKA
jgi:uncharacterized protein